MSGSHFKAPGFAGGYLLRQQRAARLAEKVYRRLDRLLDVEFVEEVATDGRRVLKAVNVGQLVPIAHLMREFARLSTLAVQDKLEEHNARVKKEGPEAGELVAGVFSLGDKMWGDRPAPEPPVETATPLGLADKPQELPPPAFADFGETETPTFDEQLKAAMGLYDLKQDEA